MTTQIIKTVNKADLLVVEFTPVAMFDKSLGYASRTETIFSVKHENAINSFFKSYDLDPAYVWKQPQSFFSGQLWFALGGH